MLGDRFVTQRVRLFEDNRPFILKTDHKNLTYLNTILTKKVLRWTLYLQDKDFYLSHVPGKQVHQGVPGKVVHCEAMWERHASKAYKRASERVASNPVRLATKVIIAWQDIRQDCSDAQLQHGPLRQRLTRKRLNDAQRPCCQVMSPIHHLDRICPLRPDAKGTMFILVILDAFSRWVELYPTATITAVETASCVFQHFGRKVDHTDRHNEIIEDLLRMTSVE